MARNTYINKAITLGNRLQMLLIRVIAYFHKGEGIWLIAEKTNEARDNGYWLYRYIRVHHPDVKAFYVLDKCSADYDKISSLGEENIVAPNSWKHKIFFWSAQYNACSQPHTDYFSSYRPLITLRSKYQVNTFLQHGITKDNLSHGIDADRSGFDLFVTSAKREQEAVMERHGYTESTCILTGLCRFDNLPLSHDAKSKIILVMPTFRHWIMTANSDMVATTEEKDRFKKDDFCVKYKSLLYSERMSSLLDRFDYKLIFYPHYCAQPFLECFEDERKGERIILASNKDYDVQKLLVESDILITDFSSIFFDFAYMKKPEIFYQFDEERYRGGHYEEGYFKYREDAFGPVLDKEEDVFAYLEQLLLNDSNMEPKYVDRVDKFFEYTDQNNCERVYNTIINYKK